MKQAINGFLIVEGKQDKSLLSSFFDVEIIITNGFDVESEELLYIIELSKKLQPIILTDSDSSGKVIREKLNKYLPTAINIEVDISRCDKHNKHGVAECEINEIISKLSPFFEKTKEKAQNYTQFDLMKLGLDNMVNRDIICKTFNLGKCNSKTLAHRLSLLEIKKENILNVIKDSQSGN